MREAGVRTDGLFLIAALILGAMGLGYVYFTSPTYLTVAVGPSGSAEERLIQAFAQQLKAQKVPIRLKLDRVAGVKEAAERLDSGKADLAVVRPDVKVPENGLTLAVLRDTATILVVPKAGGINDLTALAGRTLGVVTGHKADPALVATLLRHFDLEPPAVTLVELGRDEAAQALKEHRVDAVALVAAPTGAAASGLVREVAHALDGEIVILPVENPDGISQRSPFLAATTIPEGIWGGRPKQPAQEIKTIGVAYRLMAHSETDRSVVSTLVESLFQMRSRLAVRTRLANFMRAPEMDTASSATSAMLPNHPGAVDYFQRETQSVMDRYGDWIYLGAFFGSGAISALVWFVQRFRRRRREVIDDVLDRLLEILADARKAETADALDLLTNEVDDLFRIAVEHARDGQADNRTTSAIVLALDGARSAIEDRRRKILALGTDPDRRDGSGPRLVTVS